MAIPESPWAEDEIKIIAGNTKVLMIAPHGVATKPKDDINTDKLTQLSGLTRNSRKIVL